MHHNVVQNMLWNKYRIQKEKNIRSRFFKLITINNRKKIYNQNGDEKSIKTKNEWSGNTLRTRESCTACRAFGNVFIKIYLGINT